MDRPRFHHVLTKLAAVIAIASVAACGSTGGAQLPLAPSATPVPTATPSTTTTIAATGTPQAIPAIGGGTATVSLAAAAGTAASASVSVTASATPPSGTAAISAAARKALAIARVALAYYTFVPSVDIQLTSFPIFTVSYPTSLVPAGTTLKEAFLDAASAQPVFTYDIAFGTNGATFASTAAAPKLLAGKAYIFAFYYETGSNATPTPTPTTTASTAPTATPSPAPTSTPVPVPGAFDITVPASIMSLTGQVAITDPATFSGFGGAHVFGRGGLVPTIFSAPTLINDCKLTVGTTSLTLTGGGQTIVAPLISTNPNAKTTVIASAISTAVSFYTLTGGMTLSITPDGLVNAVSGGNTVGQNVIACNRSYASSILADRSSETFVLSPATVAALTAKATSVTSTYPIAPSDFGGASGTALIGRGTISVGTTQRRVSDCKLTMTGATVTITADGGAFTRSATFASDPTDSYRYAVVPGAPGEFTFSPTNGVPIFFQANNFGNIIAASARSADFATTLACP